jgi:hypothetical protein
MKLTKILLIALFFVAVSQARAQNTNFPDWGVAGQDLATYYYIPATETYYDIKTREFISYQNDAWVRSKGMPSAYANYDLFNGYKVVLVDPKEPFRYHNSLKQKYPKTYKGKLQATIRPRR